MDSYELGEYDIHAHANIWVIRYINGGTLESQGESQKKASQKRKRKQKNPLPTLSDSQKKSKKKLPPTADHMVTVDKQKFCGTHQNPIDKLLPAEWIETTCKEPDMTTKKFIEKCEEKIGGAGYNGLSIGCVIIGDEKAEIIDAKDLRTKLHGKKVAHQVNWYLTCGRFGADAILDALELIKSGRSPTKDECVTTKQLYLVLKSFIEVNIKQEGVVLLRIMNANMAAHSCFHKVRDALSGMIWVSAMCFYGLFRCFLYYIFSKDKNPYQMTQSKLSNVDVSFTFNSKYRTLSHRPVYIRLMLF